MDMYLNFFNLKKEPFQITPDPSFLYLSPGHKEALASIMYGVEKRKGFILIIGAVGVGKTTILRAYLEKASTERLRTIYLFNANISYGHLLKYIFRELGIKPESDEIYEMVHQLYEILVTEYREGRNVLLLIDEAQNMPIDTLENLRMLSNLETATDKLIQIVFSAQPEFDNTLNMEELKQLKQRIAVRAAISPLSAEEGLSYIQHRLKRAAIKESDIFSTLALKEIVRKAMGIPRVINVLCDNSLITAFGYGKKRVGLGVVKEIARDLGVQRQYWTGPRIVVSVVISLVVLAAYWEYSGMALLKGAQRLVGSTRPALKQSNVNINHKISEVEKVKDSSTPTKAFRNSGDERVVERGDTLAKLIKDVYGHVDAKMIRMVKKANPRINNENLIIEGGRIVFPAKTVPASAE
jgi:general secretion pathway protein A